MYDVTLIVSSLLGSSKYTESQQELSNQGVSSSTKTPKVQSARKTYMINPLSLRILLNWNKVLECCLQGSNVGR